MFREASPIIDNVMQGYNGTIFCYGVTGSGKTYTMSGPLGAVEREASSEGIVQRAATRIFEYIRDRSAGGEVFLVEASFLEVYSGDGGREQLIDLLAQAQEERKLEVKQDPGKRHSFGCEGLKRVPIQSPDEMCAVLSSGQKRCHFLETSKNCNSSCSHCLFILNIESMREDASGQKVIQRGKLMLVDLAGSESIKRVRAVNDSNEELRKKQAIGINRVLTSLGTVVTNLNAGHTSGIRDSALTMLLCDCLGGNARALLVANIGPELEALDEATKTITFAQQMMSVRNVARVNRISQDQSTIVLMRQRHQECLMRLQEAAGEAQAEEDESGKKLRQEVEALNKRLLTKASAEKTLEVVQAEQLQKMDEVKVEIALAMSRELEQLRKQSLDGIASLRQSMEQHVTSMDGPQRREQAEAQQAQLEASAEAVRAAEAVRLAAREEASVLHMKAVAAEERATMLLARVEELGGEKTGGEEERRQQRQKSEEQWQRLVTTEGEVQRWRAEVEIQKAELQKLTSQRTEDDEAWRREREERNRREAALQKEMHELRMGIEEARRGAEVQAMRVDSEHQKVIGQLTHKKERLESDVAATDEKLSLVRRDHQRLEDEQADALEQEEESRRQLPFDMMRLQEDLEEAQLREAELIQMLGEMQDSIIQASAAPAPASTGAATTPPRAASRYR